ncbi:hypothetical protein [Sphingomonas nostoxanthinifaciens]|uniref:hypothetical protein n=1 Tax=Sphingomonas nostoxanthinifaciens TaxID=2872652 RepID=UPI001CC205C6|nr:hypothetical protein [Sphingomonas nostoxanthinifaciens]
MAQWDELYESASWGDEVAAFELAMGHASGSGGLAVDLVKAHCWFNVAAARGYEPAAAWRSEIASEMTARQVSDAQKLARATLSAGMKRAA